MDAEHVDVLIVGAGLSGIGAACHLKRECPGKTLAILEGRDSIGGTWDLFRYPGIRSDSDMFTLGYSFAPWHEAKAIADGHSILAYVKETAREHGVEQAIRYGHRVIGAQWATEQARWTVQAQRADTGKTVQLTCDFLYACTGYYRYDEGHTPHFEGQESFSGQIIHPQHWPEDLDWSGKRVVVIGSGATAVTLVPALAQTAQHVTMLQRSPTYILSLPAHDPIADALRRRLPAKLAYSIVRWKNVLLAMTNFQLSRRAPRQMRNLIRRLVAKQLPDGYDVQQHFSPTYDPWDQRLCLVPDGDLFKALSGGSASVATGKISHIDQTGVTLSTGEHLDAEIIVTATGLNLLLLGGIELSVDGRKIDTGDTVAYKGMMLCGVPNMAMTLGYTNASWTLKADLVCPVRLPGARLHGRAGRIYLHAAGPAPRAADRPDHRSAVRLCAALDREAAQAGPKRPLASASELRQGRTAAAARADRRRNGLLKPTTTTHVNRHGLRQQHRQGRRPRLAGGDPKAIEELT